MAFIDVPDDDTSGVLPVTPVAAGTKYIDMPEDEPSITERFAQTTQPRGMAQRIGESITHPRGPDIVGSDFEQTARLMQVDPMGEFKYTYGSSMPVRRLNTAAAHIWRAIGGATNRIVGAPTGDTRAAHVDQANSEMVDRLDAVNSILDEYSWLGKTAGPVAGEISSSLIQGTIAAPTGPLGVATMFGLDGGERAYQESKAAGKTDDEAASHGNVQFMIDGVLSYMINKYAGSHGAASGETFLPEAAKAGVKYAEQSGLTRAAKSMMFEAGENGIQSGLSMLEKVRSDVDPNALDNFWTNVGRDTLIGGLAGTVSPAVESVNAKWKQFNSAKPDITKGVISAEQFAKSHTLDPAVYARLSDPDAPMTAEEFAKVTGIPDSNEAYRVGFRVSLDAENKRGTQSTPTPPPAPVNTDGKTFFESATPQAIEDTMVAKTAEEFEKATGIKDADEKAIKKFKEEMKTPKGETVEGEGQFAKQKAEQFAKEATPENINAVQTLKTKEAFEKATGLTNTTARFRKLFKAKLKVEAATIEAAKVAAEKAAVPETNEAPKPTEFYEDETFPTEIIPTKLQKTIAGVKSWLKVNLTSTRGRNLETDRANEKRLGETAKGLVQVRHMMQDFNQSVNDAWGDGKKVGSGNLPELRDKVSPEIQQKMADVLAGLPPDTTVLPVPVIAALNNMREHLDQFSRRMRRTGMISDSLELKLDENLNEYVTRTFRKHVDDTWAEQARSNPTIMKGIRDYLAQKFPDDKPSVNEWRINAMLNKDSAAAEKSLPREAASTAFLKLLRQKKDLPEVIRRLYGEYKDPWTNYSITAAKLAQLTAHYEFLQSIKETGLRTGMFTDPAEPSTVRPENWHKITESDPLLEPLAGLYTSPDTMATLHATFHEDVFDGIFKPIMALAGFSKYAQTVGNFPAGLVHNFIGNSLLAISNGDFDSNTKHAVKVIAGELFENAGSTMRKYELELAEQGIGFSDVTVTDIKKMAGLLLENDGDFSTMMAAMRNTAAAASNLWQAGDSIWKIAGYERKKNYYREIRPNASEADIQRMAAEDIKAAYPTHSKLARLPKKLARIPLPIVGPFASYSAEVVRCFKNVIAKGYEEVNSSNPVEQAMGRKRLIGTAASMVIPSGIAWMSRSFFGVSDREDEAKRKLSPAWSKNAASVYLSKVEDGKATTIDLSWADPRSFINDPLRAFLRGEPREAIGEALAPFYGEDLVVGRLMSIKRNKTIDGYEVYPEFASDAIKAKKIAEYMGGVLVPGGLRRLEKIRQDWKGTLGPSGQPGDLGTDIVAFFAGFRSNGLDARQAFKKRSLFFGSAMNSISSNLNSELSNKGTKEIADLESAYTMYNEQRYKLVQRWSDEFHATLDLGIPLDEAYGLLVAAGADKNAIGMIASGQYFPYVPGKEAWERAFDTYNGTDRVMLLSKMANLPPTPLTVPKEKKDEPQVP